MVPKLRAMKFLEDVGNFDAARKVGRGEIPYYKVKEDGTINYKGVKKEIEALPLQHAVMKAAGEITEGFTLSEEDLRE